MTHENTNKASLTIDINKDDCTVNMNGCPDILLQGVVGAIKALIEQLMIDYDEDDFDTNGMSDDEFRFCTTAMVLSYIMDNFDCTITSMEMHMTENEEEPQQTNVEEEQQINEINNNIQTLNFNAFGQEDNK